MSKSYVFGKDTLQFDNDDDAIKYAEETGASEFKPLDQPVAGTGYQYQTQQDYNDLYANAKEVGYSGLDSTQKQLFDQAYPYSKAAKSGMTLEQAHQATDAGLDAGNPIATADQHISQGLSDAFNNIALRPDDSGVNPNAVGYKATPANWLKAAVNIGSMVIPGEAEYRVAASGMPLIAKPIVTGLIGAGSEVAREGFNNGSVKPIPVIASGLTSGLGGLVGGYLSSKAANNEAQYIADKAKLAEDLQQQQELTENLMRGTTPRGTLVVSKRGNFGPPASSIDVPIEHIGPDVQLRAAKDYMASSRFGNTIYPENIPDLEAANFLGENIDKANKLKGTVINKGPLFNNAFNKASPRTLAELVNQSTLNAFLNGATKLGNRYQRPIGIAAGLLPSLGGPVGAYTDYRLNH